MVRHTFLQDMTRYPSLLGAILINLLPLCALIYWKWDIGTLVLLYWLENLVVGGITLLRMGVAGFDGPGNDLPRLLFLMPFFVLHYGLFCFVHGAFLESYFTAMPDMLSVLTEPMQTLQAIFSTRPGLSLVIGVVAVWRLILFVSQFLLRGDYLKSTAMAEMIRPYGRILTMHLALFAGAIALTSIGQPVWGMAGLIILKGGFDCFWVRRDATGQQSAPANRNVSPKPDPRAAGRLRKARQRRGPQEGFDGD